MTTEEYNGWTNRETWATALHIDNDPGHYAYRLDLCHDAIANADNNPEYLTEKQTAQIALEHSIKEWVESMADAFYSEPAENTGLADMFNDIGSLWRVNWREIAENWLSEYDEYEKLAS